MVRDIVCCRCRRPGCAPRVSPLSSISKFLDDFAGTRHLIRPYSIAHGSQQGLRDQSRSLSMLMRERAAICGAVLMFAVSSSSAMALTHFNPGHSSGVDRAAFGDAIIGAASTCNPFRPGWREGGAKTATGERYNPSTWTAAIQTGLHGNSAAFARLDAPLRPCRESKQEGHCQNKRRRSADIRPHH
jgi:hypothetical protein